jgi:hypothetical protein
MSNLLMRASVMIGVVITACPSVLAQEPEEPPVFQQLFPNPSGQNGYEEIIRAGESVGKMKELQAAIEAGSTLTAKRTLLSSQEAKRALTLLRQGLGKRILTPRAPTDEASFRAYSLFRNLARLLAVEQYVLLADGKVSAAVDSMWDGLRLGYAVQSDRLIGGLVGVAIDALSIQTLSRHVAQFSVRDCGKVMALARQWLAASDPAISALTAEREQMVKHIREQFSEAGSAELATQAAALLGARIDQIIATLRQPPWERKPLPPLEGNSVAVGIVKGLSIEEPLMQGLKAFTREQAMLQVLGVHAAIRAHRWEYSRLPGSLEELKLGRLAIDPFTGKSLTYRRTGETTYELTSEGLRPPAP